MPLVERLCQPLHDIGVLARNIVLVERILARIEQFEFGTSGRAYGVVDEFPLPVVDGERRN